ncbi:cupin domain-containing protein [Streptacidiphilus griseoplanus]|uniref:cupin domain-containing protein n=1 Tax=Peterkaempfera griseoplana TaxID=66896 RepID=UPI0006E3A259|nr:AraC family ligand binding domain-containing protein [Peterkaempfera griseoplana]
MLCDVAAQAAGAPEDAGGALWRLAEPGRQLDANLVRLPPGHRVGAHREPELDVLLLVVEGSGTLADGEEIQQLGTGTLVWLPQGSARELAAGPDGLACLTVHRRRPGMRIGSGPPAPPAPLG